MQQRLVLAPIWAVLVLAMGTHALGQGFALRRDLTYKQGDGYVDVLKGAQVVARYVYKDTPKPYVYPIIAPDGPAVTRGYPMEKADGEPTDHPNQRSFWIGYGSVNGIDFWGECDKCGTIVQRDIAFDSPNPGGWNIHATNDWYGPDKVIITEKEDRRYAFMSCDYGTLISTTVTLTANRAELKLGGTKDGFLAFRVAPGIALTGGKGHILNSEGLKDAACWGKRARWIDYTGEVDGKPCGIAVFDVPANYMYPTYWHARDYGLLAANPFGGKDFTGDAKSDSGLTIPRGGQIRLTYIALIHSGKLDPAQLNQVADRVAGKPSARSRRDNASVKTTPPPAKAEVSSE